MSLLELDRTGVSRPVWSNSERVSGYLQNAQLVGTSYKPHAIFLKTFTDAWLSDRVMGFFESLINPDGRSTRILAYPEEFQGTTSS